MASGTPMGSAPPAIEPVAFSTEVEKALSQVFASEDPLDSPDFSAVDYINKLFPNEQSLQNIDSVVAKLKLKVRRLDHEIRDAIHTQAVTGNEGRTALVESQQAIRELMARIHDIGAKAAVSEQMVLEITADIKALDYGKRHLTASINTLNHMHMLVGGVDTLRDMGHRRQYRDAANVLQAVVNIMTEFDQYADIPKVRSIRDDVHTVKLALKTQIRGDFDDSFTGKAISGPVEHLRDACLVLDVVGGDARQELVDWYVRLQLSDYRHVFPEGSEVSALEKVDRRFAWAKRVVATCEDEARALFPLHWRISEAVFHQFCLWLRKDLVALLAARRETVSLDVKLLLAVLQKTVAFEKYLTQRFGDKDTPGPQSQFTRLVSSCFEPYMSIYIDAQDRALGEMVDQYVREARAAMSVAAGEGQDITANGPAKVLASSSDLFLFFKNCMVQCTAMSARDPLWLLYKLFGTYLAQYAARVLMGALPRGPGADGPGAGAGAGSGAGGRLTREQEYGVCAVLNTAEYCLETTAQLEAKVREKMDAAYRDKVTFAEQQEGFLGVVTAALQTLVRAHEAVHDDVCADITRRTWAAVTQVGDTSPYVATLATALKHSIPVVRNGVASKYFHNYCFKVVSSFIPRYMAALYKCRGVTTVAGEQLLLDAHQIKELLLGMHSLDLENTVSAPASFTKYVAKGMGKAEMLLKVVMTPTQPPEMFVQSFLVLMAETDAGSFQKVLAIKTLRKPEEHELLQAYAKETGTQLAAGPSSSDRRGSGSASATERLVGVMGTESATRLKKLEEFITKFQ